MPLPLPPLIGHRGAAAYAPENTLASFAKAAELGCRMVEFDVRLGRDGIPVVFHDDTLERTTDGRGRVRDHDLPALKRLDAGGWFAPEFAGERIPTLAEALAACRDLGLAVNIEIKPERRASAARQAETAARALRVALAGWPGAAAPPLVSSFSRVALAVAQDAAPAWPRGLLLGRIAPDWRAAVAALGCTTINLDHRRLTPGRVAEFAAAGLAVLAYTVDDYVQAERLWAAGVAAIFTNDPRMAEKSSFSVDVR